MKKLNTIAVTLITIQLIISSCATILSPSKPGSNSVYITSNTPDAKIFDEKNRLIGTTPLTFKLPKEQTRINLTIEKDKHISESVIIERTEKRGFAFLDAMLLCIPCIVDYPSENIYKYNKDTVFVNLKRKYDKDVERVVLLVKDVEFPGEKEGGIIGYENKEPVYFKKSTYNSYMYKSELCGLAGENRYYVANCKIEDHDDNLFLTANTIEVTPQINKIYFRTKKISGEYIKEVDLNVTWNFGKRSGVTLKSINAVYKGEGYTMENKVLIARTLGRAFIELMDNDSNYNLLLSESKNNNVPVSKFGTISINQIKTPIFKKNKDLIQFLMKGVVTIKHDDGHGSGYFISKDGYLITNHHVVKDKKVVKVQLSESVTLAADVVRFDERYDVALLKVNGEDFNALELINSDSAQTGEDVIAIGTPEDLSLGQSVTKGIISGKRKIAEKVFLQTDVTINSGNSGGPLLNENGGVIGMVTMKLVGKGIEGIGFCVPTNTIVEVLNITYIKP